MVALVGCGDPESLLVTGDVENDVYSGESGGGYGPTSTNPSDYGSIVGTVKFEGKPYARKMETLSDKFCINARPDGMVSEEFLFDPATGGLQNVFVYIARGMQRVKFDVPSEPVILDQVGCQYIPHAAILRVGQPLRIKSSDNTLHNVAATPRNNDAFNKTMNTPSVLPDMVFGRGEPDPIKIRCDVHGWMKSYVAILSHPFCAITPQDGSFSLKDVPPGSYKLVYWHEYMGKKEMDITIENNKELKLELVFER
ncbi:MAG: hypothetical protein AAGD14_13775 [Planctomycetota bacterium]